MSSAPTTTGEESEKSTRNRLRMWFQTILMESIFFDMADFVSERNCLQPAEK